jgi:hypothetical protein
LQIVLEGCDCTGKTTLANKLEEYIMRAFNTKHVNRMHEGLPPDAPSLFEHYAVKALTYPFCIHDRLHLGERTYGPVKRNRDNLGEIGQHIIDHIVFSHGFGLICAAPLKAVVKTWKKRRETEYLQKMEELVHIYELYQDRSFKLSGWEVIDPFDPEVVDLIRKRIEFIAARDSQIPFDLGIGPSWSETLIVGEMSNHRMYDLPFFSTAGSSAYLINTLMRLGIGHNYYLTNAYRKDGSPRIMKPIIGDLKKLKRVLALGQQAAKMLVQQDIPCTCLPHPQFYHRFKHHEATEYLKLFKQAMEHNHASQLRLL